MRILILDNNINFSKEIESLLSNNKDLEVIFKTRDGNNTYEKIVKHKPDIAIIDYYLPKENIIKLIEKLKFYENKHTTLCIVTFPDFNTENYDETPIHHCLNAGAYHYFIKSNDTKELINIIHELAENFNKIIGMYRPLLSEEEIIKKNLKEEITSIILSMSIPANICGFRYIREAILLSYFDPGYLKSTTKFLYPEIAKIFKGLSGDNKKDKARAIAVERAIRNAISKGNFDNNNYNFIIKDGKSRPTTTEFLKKLVKHLQEKHGYLK